MEIRNKRINSNEKGAITLYVLIACLFFMFILSGIYISNLNKLQTQEESINQIQENYEREINNIREIYENVAKKFKVTLTQEPKNEVWTNEKVILTGTGKIDRENNDATIVGYAFVKDSIDEPTEWIEVQNEIEIIKTQEVEENGTYYFWVKDSEDEKKVAQQKVTNIDKNLPLVGELGGKEYENGEEIGEYTFGTSTDKDVYVYIKDQGNDEESEVETSYEVKKLGSTDPIGKYTDPTTLTETGTYEITLTTKDKAENKVEKKYTVIIDRRIPVLSLKHNDENGANYEPGTWTKDDLYGEIDLNISDAETRVEKYQYSNNGIIWQDISETVQQTSIDYTTTFPIGADKPDWFTGPVASNSTYNFQVQSDGTLKPNNSGQSGRTAQSYFTIDLTKYPEVELEVTIDATISSETNWDWGYAEITQSITPPQFNKDNSYFIKVSGATNTQKYTKTITGGKKYYLHLGYTKDASGNLNQDTFIINNINLKSANLGTGINFYEYNKIENKVTFKLKDEIDKEIYVRAVYTGNNNVSKYADKTSIKIDKIAPRIQDINTILESTGLVKTSLQIREDSSGLKGYYISTEETEPTESSTWTEQVLKEFTIENLSSGTTYYMWLIDNAGNISEKSELVTPSINYLVDGTIRTETLEQALEQAQDGSTIKLLNNYTDESVATINKNNIIFDLQDYTLTRIKTITIDSEKTVEIIGNGKIISEGTYVSTITNNGILTLRNNLTIESKSTSSNNAAIYANSTTSITTINDEVKLIGVYRGIYNYGGELNINGGYVEATSKTSNAACGIYSYNADKMYIRGGEVKGYNGINSYRYNSSEGLVEMTGGKVIGTQSFGIQITGNTNRLNIYGGRIEGKVYGVNTSCTFTMGRQEDELSTTNPAIYGGNYGIYVNNAANEFDFYNGVIISNSKDTAYTKEANFRTGHITYTYLDYEVEEKYCTILVPTVNKIEMESTPTEFTNGDVTVEIKYPYLPQTTRQYSEDKIDWKDATQYRERVIVAENKTIYARILNQSGIMIEESQLEVTNIDKEKPIVTINPERTQYAVIEDDQTVDISVTINATDTGVSGLDIMQYAWAKDGEKPQYSDFENGMTLNKTKLRIGQYKLYLKVTDKAGNRAELEEIRYNVKKEEAVCRIGETKYLTIQEAIEACSKDAGDTQTTIMMLKSTDEEFTTYEGQNIILDLQGVTVGSSSQNTPLCTNNGKLEIKDTSDSGNGKIESLNGIAIYNKTTGEITLGDDSTNIEAENPTIYGKKIGIKTEGTFNFYDGKIQGTAPIQGNVTDTPEGFGPVSTNYENGITTVQLGIVSGYVARIEWVYYTTLQEAVNATKPSKQETITILEDIRLEEIVQVSAAKDIILDLNKYNITVVSTDDRIMDNYGKIQIIDNSEEKTGKMIIEINKKCYGIYNHSGDITVNSGTINVTNTSTNTNINNYGIYNYKGNVTLNGGELNNNNNNTESSANIITYGIYNEDGHVKLDGGNINNINKSNQSSSYGIYNKNGDIIIEKGTLTSDNKGNSSKCYGIYNEGNASIIQNNGIIKAGQGNTNSYGIFNSNLGKVTINNGEINTNGITNVTTPGIDGSYGIYNIDEGAILIKEITLTSNGYGICNKSTNNCIIEGGTITGSVRGIQHEEGNIEISATVSSNGYGVYNKNSNITIKGGTINSISYAIYNNSGNVTIENGTLKCNTSSGSSYGIYSTGLANIIQIKNVIIDVYNKNGVAYGINATNGTLKMENGKITVSSDGATGYTYGIFNGYNSTMEIKEGIITSTGKSNNTYGIYNGNTGILKIGDDGELSKTKLFIGAKCTETSKYSGYGICNESGILEFYNGLIQGNAGAISGVISKIRENCNIKSEIIDGEETIYLENINNEDYVVEIEETKYHTLKEAIDSIGEDEEKTIKVIKDFNITQQETKFNKNMIIDLNGHIITNKYYELENTKNLKITDSTTERLGTLEIFEKGKGIINSEEGNITIESITLNVTNKNCQMICYGIYGAGSGNIIVKNATINNNNKIAISTATVGAAIYNNKEGNVILDGATINSITDGENDTTIWYGHSYGIYNMGGNVTVKNSEINVNNVPNNAKDKKDNNCLAYGIYHMNTSGIATVENSTINTAKGTTYGISNRGILNVKDVTINSDSSSQDSKVSYGIYTSGNTANVTVDGVEINSVSNNANSYGIQNYLMGTVTINSGTINSSNSSNYNNKTRSYGVCIDFSGTVIINDATIISTGYENYGLYVNQDGEMTVKGGNITGTYGAYNNKEGTINIEGGTIKSSRGVYNKSTGNITLSGGLIDGGGISNEDNGTITMTGGIIKASYGISNSKNGTVIVTNGNIEATGTGISNTSTGTIRVGEKGDGLVSEENPYIKGSSFGIYNTVGKFYFYDGKLEGTYRKAVNDTITEREDNTELNYNEDETILTLSTTLRDVAQIGETKYTSIQEAINAVGTEQTTIKLIRNIMYTNQDEKINIPNTKNIIFDLNGYTVTSAIADELIYNEGTILITDNNTVKSGTIIASEGQLIKNANGANLEIKDIRIGSRKGNGIYNEGELTITNGNIYCQNVVENGYVIYNKGNMMLNKTIISSNYYGIYNASTQDITITGGSITGTETAIYNDSLRALTIDGTVITGEKNIGISNNQTGNINIISGTIHGKNYGINNSNSGNIVIDNGTIISEGRGISNNNGTITLNEGEIRNGQYGIYTESGEIIVDKGTINNSRTGIYNNNTATITIKDGTIGATLQGIYNKEGIVNIGIKGNEISKEKPSIKGSTAIENNNGILNIYDGEISGTTKGIKGKIEEVENGTELLITAETIVVQEKETNVASVNGKEYDSIKKAIQDCGEIESTIQILRDADPGATIEIEPNQKIILDLNGYTIKNYPAMTNKGTLKIIDSSTEKQAKIEGLRNIAIANDQLLEIQEVTISSAFEYAISNTGTFTMNGGRIENSTYGIYSKDGIITVNNVTISGNKYGIYNSTNSSANILGGNIESNTYGIYSTSNRINISGATITSNEYGIYSSSSISNGNNTEINSTTINSNKYGVYCNAGTVIINSEIQGENYQVYCRKGKVTINAPVQGDIYNYAGEMYINANIIGKNYGIKTEGGTINIECDSIKGDYGIHSTGGTTHIKCPLIEGNYGIYNETGTININENSNIKGTTYGVYSKSGAININRGSTVEGNVGAYIESGTLRIGNFGGTMDPDSPTITGETNGLTALNAATISMYDGQIRGKEYATQGNIRNIEKGYLLANREDGEYSVDYLALKGTVTTVAQVNGIDYSNLQSAINSIVEGEEATVKLTNGVIVNEKISIIEGQNIILDMNGKTISSDLEITLENAGSLTIIDTAGSNVAKISSSVGTAIKNTGTLNLGQDDGTVSQELITIEGTTVGIENSGTLNFYDGTINGASALTGTITSRPEGYVIRTTTVNGKERYYLSI